MLIVFDSFKAIHSPCKSCAVRQDKTRYYNCMSFCNSSKSYLLAIGEIPHKPKQVENLSEIYKSERKYHKLKPMCSREEYKEACIKLHQIKNATGLSGPKMGQLLDMSVPVINSMLRQCEKRTEITNINKIMGYQL